MSDISKSLALLLILIMAISNLSLMMAKPVFAQSIPKPAVPEFTIRLVNNSYSTQPTTTTTTDPYTGKQTVITTPSQYVKDECIEVSIKNQVFSPYTINYHNIDNRTVNLYFNVRSKGHFSDSWDVQEVDGSVFGQTMDYGSQYTTIKLYSNNVPSTAQIDFEVQATIGYLVNQYNPEAPLPPLNIPPINFGINGTVSTWSNTQTITIPASSVSASPSPTLSSTPTVPEFPALAIPMLLSILSFAVILSLRKQRSGEQ